MDIIRIDTALLKTKIEELKVQKKKIDEILENFKGDTLKINDYWSGDTGEYVSDELKNYTNSFDYISNRLEHFIRFLENTCNSYEKADEVLIKLMDMFLDNNLK